MNGLFRRKFSEKKVIPLEVFLFFSLLPESPKLSVPFPRNNSNYLKDEDRFPKRLSLQCVSLLVGSVGGRFRTQLQPCR